MTHKSKKVVPTQETVKKLVKEIDFISVQLETEYSEDFAVSCIKQKNIIYPVWSMVVLKTVAEFMDGKKDFVWLIDSIDGKAVLKIIHIPTIQARN